MRQPSRSVRRVQVSDVVFGLMARLVHRTAQDAATRLARESLTPAQWQLLSTVGAEPGVTQVQLGRRFGTTPANVSMLIGKLEIAGLLVREAQGAAKAVELTTRGHDLVARLTPDERRFMRSRFVSLTDDELDTLHQLLKRVVEDLTQES